MSVAQQAPVVLAIDGGNVKTDLALVDADGHVLSLVRGGSSSPHVLGPDRCVALLGDLLRDAVAGSQAGDTGVTLQPVADVARVLLAGADLPEEMAALQQAIAALGWAPRLVVENDTLALLRTGTDRGWGVAVVCGGGINAIGIAPDGRELRYPSLGAITGDWGGGFDVGVAALGAAHRSADRRGPRSTLERAVPRYFGFETPLDVARAIHFKQLAVERLAELSPVVYAEAPGDEAAGGIIQRVADEVCGLAIEQRVRSRSPSATVIVSQDGPIVGATLLGLDALGAGAAAIARARAGLQRAIADAGSPLAQASGSRV